MKHCHTKIVARDGREWDALLRARTRNPAAHSKVFGEIKCQESPYQSPSLC